MRNALRLTVLKVLGIGILTVLVAPAPGATAAPEPPVVRVPSERVTGGPLPDQYFEQQRGLHHWLLEEMPDGALEAPVRIRLTPAELRDVEKITPSGPGPLRIGLVKPVLSPVGLSGLDPRQIPNTRRRFGGGVIRATGDGGFVWATSVVSEGAGGLRVRFANFRIPADADLYFFSLDGEAYGPYQGRGPNRDGEFWTHSVFGETGVILVRHFGPPDPEELRGMSFHIAQVGHIGAGFTQALAAAAGFCGNPSCVVDATCFNVTAVAAAKNAVAEMEWIQGAWIYTCTGGLLNDTDTSTEIPYFLTANHCLSKNNTARNLECFFFYRTQNCGDACPSNSGFPRTLGATVKASNRRGDYTLLELSQTPPAGTMMLGWDNQPVAFNHGQDLYRISHPNYGAQVFSHHQVDASAGTCSGWPRGERIYSNDIQGATDGGSSGSPVVNAAGQVVGQLSGACGFNVGDPCDSAANSTVDGAFAFYFDDVAPFLDPGGTGCTPTENPEVTCNDSLDNDCDGAVDCADPDCATDPACSCTITENPEATCDDGLDNDCDGAVDCVDSDCATDPACVCTLKPKGDPCNDDSECCSGKCKGPRTGKTCR